MQMSAKAIRTTSVITILVSLLLLGPWGGPAILGQRPAGHVEPAALSTEELPIWINELLAVPDVDEHEWVELVHGGRHAVYLPTVLRNHAAGGASVAPAAESGPAVLNGSAAETEPVDISGWQVTDQDGNVYTIPEDLPPLSPGDYVLIRFDGSGAAADDYDLSDRVATLHSPPGMVDVLEDDADQVALYRSGTPSAATLHDFVAYGGPANGDDAHAVQAGIWTDEQYVAPTVQVPGGDVLAQGGTVGLYPGEDRNVTDDWVIYRSDETTPGAENSAPSPYFRTPPDGIATTERRMPFGWSTIPGAISYQLQVATDPGLSSLVIDEELGDTVYTPQSDLADGIYFFRVRARAADGGQSGWSLVNQFEVITAPAQAEVSLQATSLLGITPQFQHKDSRMLCVDGHHRTGQDRWDSAHEDDGDWNAGNGNAIRSTPHDNMYCTRAAISMIVDFYGGSLSQDRISYYHYDNPSPEDDLGHGKGLWPDERCTWGSGVVGDDDVFTWAMDGGSLDCSRGKPSFADIRAYIDAGRPVLIVENNDQHSVVCDGYDTTGQLLHRVDPWTNSGGWVSYATWNISEWHCPEINTPRSDEISFWTDSDGDGVVDFDEMNRFDTSPNDPDSDDDWVNDKWDLYEVYFDAAGNHAPKAAGPDMDGDGLRKEADPDNDAGGTVDGCEDVDYDGQRDAGETNNFASGDDGACVPAFEIRSPLSGAPAEVGDKSAPDKLMVRVLAAIPPAAGTVTFGTSDFEVQIDGDVADILVPPYRVGDEYWLIVQPPARGSAGLYDLRATLLGTQTDTEADAVEYLDEPRGPIDEVLVVDNSGSMADYDKMVSAKNAARAFVDRWKERDMVALVAFSTTVAAPFPMTTVVDPGTLASARAAINAMPDAPPGSWLTAIGGGLLEGKKQLAAGEPEHAQSIVLLSDGMENVDPEWSDLGSGVQAAFTSCGFKVHTVAIGPSEASWRWLLQEIADTACTGEGEAWHTSGGGTSPTAMSLQAAGFPSALGNRLADIYLSIAELDARDQRLWEVTGMADWEGETFYVDVPAGLPEAIWTLNWVEGTVDLRLFDPDDKEVVASYPGTTHLQDATHEQFRIGTPAKGTWRVVIQNSGKDPSEYLAVLSAHSDVNMWLLFGLPPSERAVGAGMPIHVALVDHKAVTGAVISTTIRSPNQEFDETLLLYDDGKHDDREADDGLYGNKYLLQMAGTYTVKAVAEGRDNQGDPFTRYATRSFYVRPRLVYVYNGANPIDVATAYGYEGLLQDNGFAVDRVETGDVATTPLSSYEYAIVGPGARPLITGAVETLRRMRVLGLGEGGYDFFGELGSQIGRPNGWHGNETDVYAVDPGGAEWNEPYPIRIPRNRIVAVYTHTAHVGINLPSPSGLPVTLIGRESDDAAHYVIVEQYEFPRQILWGFGGPPEDMTDSGRQLFVNVAWYLE
jgi:Mg-chelatase subunit ChlD